MTTPFQQWLKFADEDAKREASEYRHHYPVEQITYAIPSEPWERNSIDWSERRRIKIVCGCNEHFAYTYGSEGHR